MTTSFVDVLLQLRDEFGADVLAGGKIYTYEAGTTTPRPTYQDLAGATANTNPVILDSAGMAVIRQTDGVAYKWVIHDADDNLLWSRDNITVGESSSSADNIILVTLNFTGTPSAQQFMGGAVFDRDVDFPVDFESADGMPPITLPGSDYTISIRKNGVEVGTATISSAGVWTFATTGGASVEFSAGDYLTFIAPDSGTAADFNAVLVGELA